MENPTYHNQIERQVYRMFESFYETNVFTRFPAVVDAEEVIARKGEHQLKIKHMMAQLALGTLVGQGPLSQHERQNWLGNLAREFQKDALDTIETLDGVFEELLEQLISLN